MPPQPPSRRPRRLGPDARTEAFARVRRASNWITAGAVAGAVVIAGIVADQLPGRASAITTGAPASGGGASTQSPATDSGSAGSNATALSPAASTPTPTQRQPVAVSGGTGY